MSESDPGPSPPDLAEWLVSTVKEIADLQRRINASPEVQQLLSNLQRFAAKAQASVTKIRLDPHVADFLARLPEWHSNLEANKALLDQGMENLEASPYRAVWHLFSLTDVLPFAQLTQQEIDERLFEHTASEPFAEELATIFESTALRAGRLPLVNEALALHARQSFGGSVTLLYSQIEGIISDALVHLGQAKQAADGSLIDSATNAHKLRGLHTKLTLAKVNSGGAVYEELLGECLVADSLAVRFAPSRNGVLHGSDIMFATRDRSTQLVLWLAALLVSLRYDARMERSASEAANG